jgi:hypothetical protein
MSQSNGPSAASGAADRKNHNKYNDKTLSLDLPGQVARANPLPVDLKLDRAS